MNSDSLSPTAGMESAVAWMKVPASQGLIRRLQRLLLLLAALVGSAGAAATDSDVIAARGTAEAEALAVMDAFLEAFNGSDVEAWADTLVFPHVRLASGTVRIFGDRTEFVAAMDMAAFAANTGWRRSSWDDMQIVQSSPDKVHIRVRFSRFDAEDNLLASYDSLYIIEPVDGRWGVRARSSFAP
ncbi:MAG: hypothetical protein AAGE43_17315, partial [Pseudomonadota bacterium]